MISGEKPSKRPYFKSGKFKKVKPSSTAVASNSESDSGQNQVGSLNQISNFTFWPRANPCSTSGRISFLPATPILISLRPFEGLFELTQRASRSAPFMSLSLPRTLARARIGPAEGCKWEAGTKTLSY